MPILPAPFLKGSQVGIIGRRAIGVAWFTIAPHTFALDIAQMRSRRTRPGPGEIDQPGLDGHTPGTSGQRCAGKVRCRVAAPQPGTGSMARLGGLDASLARLAQHLTDKGIAALLGRSWTEAETVFIVTAHTIPPSKAVAARRARHALCSMPPRPWRSSRHGAATGACRATPTCRLLFRATTCRDLLSCPPPLPLAVAPGIGGPAALCCWQPARRRTRPQPKAGHDRGKTSAHWMAAQSVV